MNEMTHIISPWNAGWVSWTMLVLLACALIAEFLQRGIITQAPQTLWAHSDRTYKDAPINFGAQVLISLFRIGTIAMAVSLCHYSNEPFQFVYFLAVCGILFGILVAKMACHAILDYTFTLSRRFSIAYEHYANVLTLVVTLLYPVLLVLLRVGNPVAGRWALAISAGVFLLLWLYRGGRTLITSPMAILYFALYICTLEVVPMAALYYFSGQMMTYL